MLGNYHYINWWCCSNHLQQIITHHESSHCQNHHDPESSNNATTCKHLQEFLNKSQRRQVTPRSELDDRPDSDAENWVEQTYDTYVQVTCREIECPRGFKPEPTMKSYFGRDDEGDFAEIDKSTWKAREQREGFKAGDNVQCCACTIGPCTYYGRTLVLDVEVYWPEPNPVLGSGVLASLGLGDESSF